MGYPLQVEWLGTVRYADALAVQLAAVEQRRLGRGPDRLLLLEHPPVVTLGRSAKREHVKTPLAQLEARGVDVHEVARGGDVTYHGRGQLVGYLVADLAARGEPDVTAWLRRIEAALIDALAELGVPARRMAGRTGVFVDDEASGSLPASSASPAQPGAQRGAAERSQRGSAAERSQRGSAAERSQRARKIASIGVGLRGWVTYHGFALNATLDLAEFDDIVPCGLHDVAMTSVAEEKRVPPTQALFDEVREVVAEGFARCFA